MEIQLTAKHLKITLPIRDYVQQKMEKAQKYFDHIVWGQVFVSIEKRAHNAEMIVHAPGQTFRALATTSDLYSAIDLASDKIDAQLKKYKERLKSRHKPNVAARQIDAEPGLPGPIKTSVIKQTVSPMTPGEAAAEMEALGHNFRLYQDRDSQQIHVIYRGADEAYRILQPVKQSGH